MDKSQLLLIIFIVFCVGGLFLEGIYIINANRRKHKWNERRVLATVTWIDSKADPLRDTWYLNATWRDQQSGQLYTFRSKPLTSPPIQRVGDSVMVIFDPVNPHDF